MTATFGGLWLMGSLINSLAVFVITQYWNIQLDVIITLSSVLAPTLSVCEGKVSVCVC